MLGDGLFNSGDKGSYFKYNYAVLKLLEGIQNAIAVLPGVDYELIYTSYKAKVAVGGCYSIGDFIQRIDIVNAATGVVASTKWFNETTGVMLSGACVPVPIANLDPYVAPSNTNANITAWLGSVLPTVGQKVMASSIPVVIASNQTAVPISSATLATAANQLTEIASLSSIDGKLIDDFGAAPAALRVAALLGNAAGIADFNAGITTAQTLRVVLPTDQTSIPVTGPLTDAQLRATPVPVVLPAGAEVLTSTLAVANGSTAGGENSAAFVTSAGFVGTINGVARSEKTFYGFSAETGKTLPAIAYTIAAGSINIDTLT